MNHTYEELVEHFDTHDWGDYLAQMPEAKFKVDTKRICRIRVMTFNIRGAFFTQDDVNAWQNRAALNVETIKRHAPDLIGFQELHTGNLETYQRQLTEYEYMLGLPCDKLETPAHNALFWKSSQLNLVNSGGFYLSKTPDKWSSDWDSALVREATWAKFRCAANDVEFLHLNTHLDHHSEWARREGGKLILRQIAKLRGDGQPVMVTGDFNCTPADALYHHFVKNGFVDAYRASGNRDTITSNTFHGFKGPDFEPWNPDMTVRIDWILTQDGRWSIQTNSCTIIHDNQAPLYPSDHYPVLADLTFYRSGSRQD